MAMAALLATLYTLFFFIFFFNMVCCLGSELVSKIRNVLYSIIQGGEEYRFWESEQRFTVRFTVCIIPLFICKSHSHSHVLNPGTTSANNIPNDSSFSGVQYSESYVTWSKWEGGARNPIFPAAEPAFQWWKINQGLLW